MEIRLVLLLLCLVITTDAIPEIEPLTCQKSDVGFLLDTSLRQFEFNQALAMIQGLVTAFEVKPRSSRAGLATFSDRAVTRIEFGKFASGKVFNREVRKIKRSGRGKRIDKGLIEATEVLYNQKYNPQFDLQKFLFVITDGRLKRRYRYKSNLKYLTRYMRHQGVRIISIAVGLYPETLHMNEMVQFPDREVIFIRRWSNINKMVKKVRRLVCSRAPTVPVECVKKGDFVFLLDQSSSIGGPQRFDLVKDFVKKVVNNFRVPDRIKMTINVGVILYANKAELKIELGKYDTFTEFEKAMDNTITYRGGTQTRIDSAVTLANKVFNGKGGDRPGVPDHVILMTDGKQNSGSYEIDSNLPNYARPLWKKNITVFAVGVAGAKLAQLRQLAGKTGRAIYRKRLEDLKDTVNEVIPSECSGCHSAVNLGFVLDASGTARQSFERTKRLVYYIIEGFKTQRTEANVCAIRFSTAASVDIHFGEFSALRNFQVELDTNMPFIGRRSNLHKGLEAAEGEFEANGNKNLPNVLIVLTDGFVRLSQTRKIKEVANRLRKKGFHIVAVSIGRCRVYRCWEVFRAIAGSEKNVMTWKKKDDIIKKAENIARMSCPKQGS